MQKTLVLALALLLELRRSKRGSTPSGRDSGPHVDEHFLTSREIV